MAFEEIEKLKERLAKDPSSKLFVPLAEEYRKAGMFDEAIEVLKSGLESQPSYMSARVSLGKIYLEKEMIEEARAEFEQVAQAIPDNLFAHKKLAEIYKELGDPIKALQRYELVLQLNPLDEDAKINLESLSGAPVSGNHEAPAEASSPAAPEQPVPEPEPAPAPSHPVSSIPEDIPSEPAHAKPEPAPAPPRPDRQEPKPAPEPARQSPPEPDPAALEPDSADIETEPVSAQLGGAPLDQTPVEMSNDEGGLKLEDMLMHEEIKAEAADMGADFRQFSQSFSSDLREKDEAPEKPKDDTPMYYMGEEPGTARPEEREVSREKHPFERFAENEGPSSDDDMSAHELSEETLASVPVIEDGEEIPEVSLSEDELEEIEAGFQGGIGPGFDEGEEEETVPEITLSESELEEASSPDMPQNFSLGSNNDAAAVLEDPPAVPDLPPEPVTSFAREEAPISLDSPAEKALFEERQTHAPEKRAFPGGDPDMLQELKRAEVYIDAGDFVQAVQYYDMLLKKFPGERKILQKLEELKTYLKMTGKGQEMVIQKMEILLKGIQKRKNEFFGSA